MAHDSPKKRPKWARGLNDREFRFVSEWLVDLSYRGAAIRSGLVGSTDDSTRSMAYEMAHRPHMTRAMDEALADDASGPRQWITTKLRAIADANMGDFFIWDENNVCTIKPWKDMPREVTALVREIVQTKDGVRLKLHDPVRALELLAKVGSIGLTRERLVVEDTEGKTTPDIDLARRIAFLLSKAARAARADA